MPISTRGIGIDQQGNVQRFVAGQVTRMGWGGLGEPTFGTPFGLSYDPPNNTIPAGFYMSVSSGTLEFPDGQGGRAPGQVDIGIFLISDGTVSLFAGPDPFNLIPVVFG